jgi:DNA-binding beta-propeller fold protein YncE
MWVANQGSNNVTKLRANDGTVLGTFAVGTDPIGLAFDGLTSGLRTTVDFTVTKLRASDGAELGTFPVGKLPVGVAFDGANIWLSQWLPSRYSQDRSQRVEKWPVANYSKS